jgi:hypothetical protein
MENEELKEEIRNKRKNNWIEAWFCIEALAVNKEVVESSLKEHVEKLSKVKEAFIYEKKFSETKKVENPIANIKEAFSQIVELKLFIKDLFSLISIVIVYGPSSVEIIGPRCKEVKAEEIQRISNVLSGIIHQFASAGIGGIVITPEK